MVYVPIDIDRAVVKECRRRRLSPMTMKTYLIGIRRFLNWSKKDLGHISKKDVRRFLTELSEAGLSGSSLNVYHMAIRFLFVDVLDRRMWVDIKYSKVSTRLPVVLSRDEVKQLFGSIHNKKHKLMIQLMYAAGLRVSELTNIKVEDIVLDQGFGYVRKGKGAKDRLFIISPLLAGGIQKLIADEGLGENSWLFTSNRKTKYDTASVRKIVGNAAKQAKLKHVHPHALRHSFSTHLIEHGHAVNEVQSLLGHKSPETTMVYVHQTRPTMIGIRSPFDSL
jgi:integrase/recombinase XerD